MSENNVNLYLHVTVVISQCPHESIIRKVDEIGENRRFVTFAVCRHAPAEKNNLFDIRSAVHLHNVAVV